MRASTSLAWVCASASEPVGSKPERDERQRGPRSSARKRSSRGLASERSRGRLASDDAGILHRRLPREAGLAPSSASGSRCVCWAALDPIGPAGLDGALDLPPRSRCASSSEEARRAASGAAIPRYRPSTSEHVDVVASRTRGTLKLCGLRAVAVLAVLLHSSLHHDVAARQRRLHGPPRRCPRLRGPGRRRRPDGTPMATSANWRPRPRAYAAAWRSMAGVMPAIASAAAASALPGTRSIRTSTFERIRRAAAARTSAATNSAAIESAWWLDRNERTEGRRARRPSPSQVAEEMERIWIRAPRFEGARGAPARRSSGSTSMTIAMPTTTNAYQRCVDLDIRRAREALDSAEGDEEARERRGSTLRRALRGAPPCRGRTRVPVSAGRAATPTAKNVSSAATRSVPSGAPRRAARGLSVASAGAELDRDQHGSPRSTDKSAVDARGHAVKRSQEGGGRGLEVAAERLLALDRLEQRLEVAVAEAARAGRSITSKKSVGRSCAVFVKICSR